MNDFIGIDVQGILGLKDKFAKLPNAVQDAIVDEVSDYLLDVLKLYPPPKYVTRKAAYGRTFFTSKQRKWFFWALDTGRINVPYHRTQGMREAWRKIGEGRNAIIANETQAAIYTMGVESQSRHEQRVGWKTIRDILMERNKQIQRAANIGLKKGIKKAGLSSQTTG